MPGAYRPNPDFEEELTAEPEFGDGMRQQAEVARARAESLAPRIMPRAGSPQAFQVQQDADGTYLVNTDHGGHLAEFGSVNNPPIAPLRRGVKAAGFRLVESDVQ
jgi:hypothetical protein